jgi:hypothetical protein
LASCADCLLRFINGRRMGNALRPASSSSVVLERPKRILQGIQVARQSRDATKKRERWTGGQEGKRQTGRRLQTEEARQPLSLTGSKREDWARTNTTATSARNLHASNDTDCEYLLLSGRRARQACTCGMYGDAASTSRNPERGGASARAGAGKRPADELNGRLAR